MLGDQTDSFLRNSRFLHLDDDDLAAYKAGRLDAFGQARARAHLDICLICDRRLAARGPAPLARPVERPLAQVGRAGEHELAAALEGRPAPEQVLAKTASAGRRGEAACTTPREAEEERRSATPAETTPTRHAPVQVGILTKGRPMLATVIANLLVQEEVPLEIFVIDTGDPPANLREDVGRALRLAQDVGIACHYELHRDEQRSFSIGRLKLLEKLTGPLVAFMDDDVVLPGTALAALARRAAALGPRLGWVAPLCIYAYQHRRVRGFLHGRPHYSPGGIFAQDATVRSILRDYYASTADVLDARGPSARVWELVFLTELFQALDRVTEVQPETVSYHLADDRSVRWDLQDRALLETTRRELRRLLARYAPEVAMSAQWQGGSRTSNAPAPSSARASHRAASR